MTDRPASLDPWLDVRKVLDGAEGAAGIAACGRVEREVARLVAEGRLPAYVRPLRIACLRTVTIEPVVASLVAAMAARDFAATVTMGQLGNYAEEIASADSFLYSGGFDVCIVLAPIDAVVPGFGDPGAGLDDVEPLLRFHLDCLETAASRFAGLVIACNFAPPGHLLAPCLQAQTAASARYAVSQANHLLASWAEGRKNVVVSDVARAAGRLGTERFYSARNMLLSMQPYSPEGFGLLANDWARLCQLHFRGPAKCIVVDCDNTLWGGIVGEDGLHGIRLGETYPGVCFQQFQRQLKQLKDLGFLLAIDSRNNEPDVRRRLRAASRDGPPPGRFRRGADQLGGQGRKPRLHRRRAEPRRRGLRVHRRQRLRAGDGAGGAPGRAVSARAVRDVAASRLAPRLRRVGPAGADQRGPGQICDVCRGTASGGRPANRPPRRRSTCGGSISA